MSAAAAPRARRALLGALALLAGSALAPLVSPVPSWGDSPYDRPLRITTSTPKYPNRDAQGTEQPDGQLEQQWTGTDPNALMDPSQCAPADVQYCDTIPLLVDTDPDRGPRDDFQLRIIVSWTGRIDKLSLRLWDNKQIKSADTYEPRQPGDSGYTPEETTSEYSLVGGVWPKNPYPAEPSTSRNAPDDDALGADDPRNTNGCRKFTHREPSATAASTFKCKTMLLPSPGLRPYPESDDANYNLVITNTNGGNPSGYFVEAWIEIVRGDEPPREKHEPAPPPTPPPTAPPTAPTRSTTRKPPVPGAPPEVPPPTGGAPAAPTVDVTYLPRVPVPLGAPAGPSPPPSLSDVGASVDPLLRDVRGAGLEEALRAPEIDTAALAEDRPKPVSGTTVALSLLGLPVAAGGGGLVYVLRRRSIARLL